MNFGKVGEWIGKAKDFGTTHQDTILTGLAIVGVWTSMYMAYKAGPKAYNILAEKKEDLKHTDPEDKATKRAVVIETVKEMAPVVAPPVVMGAVTTACILGSHNASQKKVALLNAAYTTTTTAFKDYKDHVKDILGEDKADKVREKMSLEKLQKDGPVDMSKVIETGNGYVLCKDSFSGQLFHSCAEKINEAVNELSADLMHEMWVSVNDFYYCLNLPSNSAGEKFGWPVEALERGRIPITFTACLTADNQPCLVVEYDPEVCPKYR